MRTATRRLRRPSPSIATHSRKGGARRSRTRYARSLAV
jgi:hypothetical protein